MAEYNRELTPATSAIRASVIKSPRRLTDDAELTHLWQSTRES